MRQPLADRVGQSGRFRARVHHYGLRVVGRAPKGRSPKEYETVMLTDVYTLDNQWLCFHVWLAEAAAFRFVKADEGDVVEFTATIQSYRKGYAGKQPRQQKRRRPLEKDYTFRQIIRVEVLKRAEGSIDAEVWEYQRRAYL